MRQRDVVAASVILGISFLLAMALVAWFSWTHIRKKRTSVEDQGMNEYSVDGESPATPITALVTARSWKERLGSKRQNRGEELLPSLATFLKAGDEDIFSSDIFRLQAFQQSDSVSLDILYDALVDAMRSRPAAERLAYSRAMSQFIVGRKPGRKRRQSVPTNPQSGGGSLVRRRSTRSFDTVERGVMMVKRRKTSRSQYLIKTSNSFPITEKGVEPTASYTWWEIQPVLDMQVDGALAMEISSEELATLSILLACGRPSTDAQIPDGDQDLVLALSDVGAFGISIKSASAADGMYLITLMRHQQHLSEQVPQTSSGHSMLLAKYMACGSLPLSRGPSVTNCLLISRAGAKAIFAGSLSQQIQEKNELESASAVFFSSLPHSRALALYDLETGAPTAAESPAVSAQLPEQFLEVLTRLPYTTLPPLASIPLVAVIRFIASAGLPPGRLLQRLESLVEKVHNYSPGLSLFGPLYEVSNAGALLREKNRLGKLTSDSTPKGNVGDTLAQKTARLHRYGILMERLMGLLAAGGLGKEEVRKRVNDATRNELLRSYSDALSERQQVQALQDSPAKANLVPATPASQDLSNTADPVTPSKNPGSGAQFTQTQIAQAVTPSSISSRRSGSTRRSGASAPPNLGSQLEDILKAGLPLSVPQVAFVGRLMLVAWSLSVGKVAWEEGEEGMRFEMLADEKIVMV